MKDYNRYLEAVEFAVLNYKKKREKSEINSVVHPLRVVSILRAAGFSEFEDSDIMIAALFHDLIEDESVKRDTIKNLFGYKVADIVEELSRPEGRDKTEWLKSLKFSSKEAKAIKLADRIDNLRDMEKSKFEPSELKDYAEQGKIVLESCADANQELAFELKLIIQKILKEPRASGVKSSEPHVPTVLIVYPERDISWFVEKNLKNHGINAITCDLVFESLNILEKKYSEIDLVLTDLTFVDGSAERLLKALREIESYRHIVALTFSVKSFSEDIEEFKALGAVDHITIPFSSKELVNTVKSYLKLN